MHCFYPGGEGAGTATEQMFVPGSVHPEVPGWVKTAVGRIFQLQPELKASRVNPDSHLNVQISL